MGWRGKWFTTNFGQTSKADTRHCCRTVCSQRLYHPSPWRHLWWFVSGCSWRSRHQQPPVNRHQTQQQAHLRWSRLRLKPAQPTTADLIRAAADTSKEGNTHLWWSRLRLKPAQSTNTFMEDDEETVRSWMKGAVTATLQHQVQTAVTKTGVLSKVGHCASCRQCMVWVRWDRPTRPAGPLKHACYTCSDCNTLQARMHNLDSAVPHLRTSTACAWFSAMPWWPLSALRWLGDTREADTPSRTSAMSRGRRAEGAVGGRQRSTAAIRAACTWGV